MGNFHDLTGQKFGRLTVLGRAENKDKRTMWLCKCDCGKTCVVDGYHLRSGHSRSCGCLVITTARNNFKTHGLSKQPVYIIWKNIKHRCFYAKSSNYERYGGRGITMHPAWVHDFQAFYDYVSKLEHFGEEGYSLDRIDNNGNYEPDNVRWADAKMQARNRRSNRIVEFQDEKMSLEQALEKSGVNRSTYWSRRRRGEVGKDLFRPVKKNLAN